MGVLLPEDFPISSLPNEAERRVVQVFRDGLSDGWLIIPDVSIRGSTRDRQLDVVLIHRHFGIIDIEVKGHRVTIVEGLWRDRDGPLDPQPIDQAKGNAYALRDQIRAAVPSLSKLDVEYGVALPNTSDIQGRLPIGLERAQVITNADLEQIDDAIEALAVARWHNAPLSATDLAAVLGLIAPSVEITWDPEARARSTRRRLDDVSADQVAVLERLDSNRRVAVRGGAGTGKTRLATAWARRAFAREERTLFVCYNEPLAANLRAVLPHDPAFTIGAFLTTALRFDGMVALDVPDGAGDEWWNIHAVGHLHRHWHLITERFDTVIIDEAQDFSPAWLAQLAALLDPRGPRRMMLVADENQVLYPRGFAMPAADDGWTVAELFVNCRNAHEIAKLLRRFLHGAQAPQTRPEAIGVRWVAAHTTSEVVAAVNEELRRLGVVEHRSARSILVETVSSKLRDTLRAELGLVRWEDRGDTAVVGENVHRAKGLEADTVILAAIDADVTDELLYVGISRAISELVVVGPEALAARLGLA